ncbi:hypothetical protein [Flavobacterium sp. 3HN19-14]|uniref:hypothetical protein n=1 Tax=Flavobacterium sp. 3HN19-14 TaxID=3448133 RepID=UPI003EE3B448
MKKITLILFIAFCVNCFSQDQQWLWAKPILGSEGNETDKAMAVATDANNNIFVVGQFTSNTLTFPGYDYDLTNTFPINTFESFVAKYDTSGNIIWAKKISGSGAEKASCIAVDSVGNFYVAGIFDSISLTIGSNVLTNAGGNDIFIVKYDTNGNVIWAKSDGGTGDEYCNGIAVDINGNIIIAGGYKSPTLTIGSITLNNGANSNDDSDILIAKYDNAGNSIWAKSWNGTAEDMANDVAVDASGNIIFTGYFHSPSIGDGSSGLTADTNTESSIFLIKCNPSGELFWQRKWSGSLANVGRDLTVDSEGGIYFIAQYQGGYITFETTTLYSDVNGASTVVKYNPNGSVAWAKICASSRVLAKSVAVDSNKNLYVAGDMLNGFSFGESLTYQFELGDIAILKYNNDGSEAWAHLQVKTRASMYLKSRPTPKIT